MSGVAELALGIVGAAAAIDVAVKACKGVIRTCSTVRHAEMKIHELSTRLQSNCLQISTQLDIFLQIQEGFNEERQTIQMDVFEILAFKLEYAHTKLKGIVGSQDMEPGQDFPSARTLSKRERATFALKKSSLDKAIEELELWQRVSFDPLWFASMKAQTQHFDKKLDFEANETLRGPQRQVLSAAIAMRDPLRDLRSARVFLPPEKLEKAKAVHISFSSATLVQVDDKWRLLESMLSSSKDTVRELAVRLKRADPMTFGLLKSLGAIHDQKRGVFSMVFRIPDRMSEPQTLREKMLAGTTPHSLSERYRLAIQLARAVSSIHTFDMVHKSIRPENIILFKDSGSVLGSAFLLGFEKLRREDGETRLTGDTNWAKNIYRHPERQGTQLLERYIMQHDIYSLGVCLLEIGLWTTFVEYDQNQTPVRPPTYDFCGNSFNETDRSEATKSQLLALTTTDLPTKMGNRYAKVVESCLTCLDLGNDDFGDEDEEVLEDDVAAIRYIEKVLMKLGEISV